MSFPRYPAYKDTGLEWLPVIPTSWETRRLKQFCTVFPSNVDKKSVEGETPVKLCNYTDVYHNDSICAEMEFMDATASEEQATKFALRAGDVIITKDSEAADDIAIAAYVPETLPGVVCGYHLSMIRPRSGTNGAYVKRVFDSTYAKSLFAVRANGLTRVGLSQYAVDNVELPLPPSHEQVAIATFLDRETAKIDALIAEQQRLIELLQEKRQAVISHAVTKGLNPNAPMKDSGVEWLGEVPEHWELLQLKRLSRPGSSITYGIVQAGPHIEDGIPYIRTSDMSGDSLSVETCQRTSHEIDKSYTRSKVNTGDLVVAIRATVGKVLVVPEELDGANLTQGTAKFSPGNQVLTDFIRMAFESRYLQAQIDASSKGATFAEITLEALRRLVFAVPPISEQAEIASRVNALVNKFAGLISDSQRSAALLQERRSALISAAVTGQIDVRGLAPEAAAA